MTTPSSPSDVSRRVRRARLLMIGSTACFVTNVLLIRALAGFENVSVWVVTCARFVVGLAIVLVVYRRAFQGSHLFTRRKLVERGVLGGVGTVGFYYTVTALGAGRATFINSTYILWGGLFAVLALGERLRVSLLGGAAVALTGLGLLTNPFARGLSAGVQDAVALAFALCAGWIIVTIRQLHREEHSSTIFAAQCVYGLLLCAGPAVAHLGAPSPEAWGVIALASACAGAGQLLMTHAYRELPIAEGALLQMLVPLGIALGGMVFFAEHFTGIELIGGALILLGTTAPALLPARKMAPANTG